MSKHSPRIRPVAVRPVSKVVLNPVIARAVTALACALLVVSAGLVANAVLDREVLWTWLIPIAGLAAVPMTASLTLAERRSRGDVGRIRMAGRRWGPSSL